MTTARQAIGRAHAALAILFALLLVQGLAGCSSRPVETRGPIIDLRDAELAFSTSDTPPKRGWHRATLPLWSLEEEAKSREDGGMVAWLRFHFDGKAAGPGPHALYTEDIAERYIAWLNGVNVHRTYAGKDDMVIGWNRPELATLPVGSVRKGDNLLLLRIDTGLRWFLSAGHVKVGALAPLRDHYQWRHFWRIDGARIANFILMALTVFIFLLWIARRKHEPELIWLVGVGLLYWFRSAIFYFERPPFEPTLFALLSQTSLFFLPPVAFGFYAEFLKIAGRAQWNIFYFGVGSALAILSAGLAALGYEGRECTVVMLAVAIFSTYVAFRTPSNADNLERILMLVVISATIAVGVHDLGRQDHLQLWDGPGFFIQPYNGLAIFTAFFILIGRRFLAAMSDFETLNAELENRVTLATSALADSEAARRKLEVEKALESERERLMREVHDGIGSNLVTALAVAQRENLPEQAIGVLRRAVSDLKITVDSLDPMKGDVLALLGNLRHRLEPDLMRAGIETRWQVLDCPPLAWLDSANALQFLRLMQEAVSNAIAHSGTELITFEAAPHDRDGVAGIRITLTDTGSGFAGEGVNGSGKGLANMRFRAAALSGVLDLTSLAGRGTKVALWLPLQRSEG